MPLEVLADEITSVLGFNARIYYDESPRNVRTAYTFESCNLQKCVKHTEYLAKRDRHTPSTADIVLWWNTHNKICIWFISK